MGGLILLKIQRPLEEMGIDFPSIYAESTIGIEEKENSCIIYFDTQVSRTLFCQQLINSEKIKKEEWVEEDIKERDWNAIWESSFKSINIDQKCLIRSSFHVPEKDFPYEIIIDPKMSFGTGHHETTHMMIQFMLDQEFIEKSVFDCGSGTGVLAIQAEKMGAKEVLAIDNEHWAYENAMQNIVVNNCKNITVKLGELTQEMSSKRFEIILANINRNVLLNYIPVFKKMILPGGSVFLSGILKTDLDVMSVAIINCGFHISNKKSKGEWLALELKLEEVT